MCVSDKTKEKTGEIVSLLFKFFTDFGMNKQQKCETKQNKKNYI